ncbi:hypothetical protein PJ985_04900 [Streptomyces sp. ACA25]|uniref:WD40/YVTN/BNR-like repeat-containing protein n=1 Tax=Streptomyces sp. ACA25 TaxID=3022596 RepID=UPI002307046A|nr:hypothetical protein [Streptomyces sp. ACA25]MDB1086901.1 hypothetical protein [Streptomyces sp. ACA25]
MSRRVRTGALTWGGALLLAVAPLTGCTTDGAPRETGPTTATADPHAVEPPRIPSAQGLPGEVQRLLLADERHGFAQLLACSEAPEEGCRSHLLALEDGADWELRDLPPELAGEDTGVTRLLVAGPGRARLETDAGYLGAHEGEEELTAWKTFDGARSWEPAGTGTPGTLEEIPAAAPLHTLSVPGTTAPGGGDGTGEAEEPERLAALDPETGEFGVLAEQPPLRNMTPVAGTLPDGSHAVSGLDPETAQPAVAVSADRGRNWRTSRLPGPQPGDPEYAPVFHALTVGPDVLYATVTGGPDAHGTVLGIHRSTDLGDTWERTWDPSSGPGPATVLGQPVAAGDGSLTVHAQDGIHRSEDGGRTFTEVREGPPPEFVVRTPAGHLAQSLEHQGHYRISADGYTWHTIILTGE